MPVITAPIWMSLACQCEGVPVGPSVGPFSPCMLRSCRSEKIKKCITALQLWQMSCHSLLCGRNCSHGGGQRTPATQTNRRPGILRNGNRWANNTSCCVFYFSCFSEGERERLDFNAAHVTKSAMLVHQRGSEDGSTPVFNPVFFKSHLWRFVNL